MQYHDLIGTFTQQDVDLVRVFNDVAVFNAQVNGPEHMENVASLACRSALTKRGVAHLSISNDVQEQSLENDTRSKRNQPRHEPNRRYQGLRMPSDSDVQRRAARLNQATKLASLVGRWG